VHFAQTSSARATVWDFCSYSVHFAQAGSARAMVWDFCTLPSLPSMRQLTSGGAAHESAPPPLTTLPHL
jgi:hypothetical protein